MIEFLIVFALIQLAFGLVYVGYRMGRKSKAPNPYRSQS